MNEILLNSFYEINNLLVRKLEKIKFINMNKLCCFFTIFFIIPVLYCANPSRQNSWDPKGENYQSPSLIIQTSELNTFLDEDDLITISAKITRSNEVIISDIPINKLDLHITKIDDLPGSLPVIFIENNGSIKPLSVGIVEIQANYNYNDEKLKSNKITFEVKQSQAGIDLNPASLIICENYSANPEECEAFDSSFAIKLKSAPSMPVYIDLSHNYEDIVTLSEVILIFDEDNFEDEQIITVNAVDNGQAGGNSFVILMFSPGQSEDNKYNDLELAPIDVTILDDDTYPIASPVGTSDGLTNVPLYQQIKVKFDKNIKETSITSDTFYVWDGVQEVPGILQYSSAQKLATITFYDFLKPGAEYSVYVLDDITDIFDNNLYSTLTWTFRTTEITFAAINNCAQDDICMPSAGNAQGVTVSGDYAYVADRSAGMQIVDITDPAALNVTGACLHDDVCMDSVGGLRYTYSIYVDGNTAYIADYEGGIYIINITDPALPSQIGKCPQSTCLTESFNTRAVDLFLSGTNVYVANNDTGLQIVDVSIPGTPSVIGEYNQSGWTKKVFVSGNYAYTTNSSQGLEVIDIAAPATPGLQGFYDPAGTAYDIFFKDSFAFLTASTGFYVIGLENLNCATPPCELTLHNSLNTTAIPKDLTIDGNYAYTAFQDSGIQLIDISNPENLHIAGTYNTPGTAWDMDISGDYVFVADYDNGLQVLKKNEPEKYVDVVNTQFAYGCKAIKKVDFNVFIGCIDNKFHIIDISDSSWPQNLGYYHWTGGGQPYGFDIDGDIAYVLYDSQGLFIVDISDPQNTNLLGSWFFIGDVEKIQVEYPYAYIAHTYDGLEILNISDPGALVTESTCADDDICLPASVNVLDVWVINSTAYVAGGLAGFQIVSVADPQAPSKIGTGCLQDDVCLPSGGSAGAVLVSGNYAYIAEGNYGLQVIDITDELAPSKFGECLQDDVCMPSIGSASRIAKSGNYLYVADGNAGLQIIDVSVPSSPSVVKSITTFDSASDIILDGNYAYVADDTAGLQIFFIGTYQ
jgi:hypothetical protein